MSIIYLTDCLTSDTKIKLAAILVRVIVWITAMPESLLLNLINLPNQIQTLIEMSYLCQAFVEHNSRIRGVSWCCGNYCQFAFVLWCGYCSVSFQSFVLRHWCPQHQETTRISLAGRAEAHQWLYELALSSFPINSLYS